MKSQTNCEQSRSTLATGSDPYDAKISEWCAKHGVTHPEQGEPAELFIEPESEMDYVLQEPEIKGNRVILSDLYGWAESYKLTDLRDHVAKHGKLSTWDDFAKLSDLESKDVSDDW